MAAKKDHRNPEPGTHNAAEEYEAERRAGVAVETSAMRDAFAALQPLDNPARKRTLRWLSDALENIEVPF